MHATGDAWHAAAAATECRTLARHRTGGHCPAAVQSRPLPPHGRYTGPPDRGPPLAKPNYSFEKRQRELAKKKQKEEKEARKREARNAGKETPSKPDENSGPA